MNCLSVDHQELAVAVEFAVTGCEVGQNPDQVEPSDTPKFREVHAVRQIFDIDTTLVKVFEPSFQRF